MRKVKKSKKKEKDIASHCQKPPKIIYFSPPSFFTILTLCFPYFLPLSLSELIGILLDMSLPFPVIVLGDFKAQIPAKPVIICQLREMALQTRAS